MHKQRLEAFSDGVIAIIITIMVLELKVPQGEGIKDLLPLIPVLIGYVLSFIFVAIYWNNHHHLLQAALANAVGSDTKGYVSLALYALAVIIAFWFPIVAYVIYALVAMIWFIPDRRIEKELERS